MKKSTVQINTLFLFIILSVIGSKLSAQMITVTGTISLNPNGVVDCYLNYPKFAASDKTVLFLDTASHLRYIRKKKKGDDSPWQLDWSPTILKNCFYYSTSKEKDLGGLPDQFNLHYYFVVPSEADYSVENMEEALSISAIKKKCFPVLYNLETGKTFETVNYQIFLERKQELGLDIKFVELEYEDPFYFAMSTPSIEDLKTDSNTR